MRAGRSSWRVSARSNSTAARAEIDIFQFLVGGFKVIQATDVKSNNSSQPAPRWRRRGGGQATVAPRGHRMQRRGSEGRRQQSWFNRLPAAAAAPAAATATAASEGQLQVLRAVRL